jgi:hypothetical protein
MDSFVDRLLSKATVTVDNINVNNVSRDVVEDLTEAYRAMLMQSPLDVIKSGKYVHAYDSMPELAQRLSNIYSKDDVDKIMTSLYGYLGKLPVGDYMPNLDALYNRIKSVPYQKDINLSQYSKYSAKAQAAMQKSIESDAILRTKINAMERITEKDFKRIESLSKIKGLNQAAKDVNTSVIKYNKAIDVIKTTKIGTPAYVKRMATAENAKAVANKAIDTWDTIIHQQRYNLSPSVESNQTASFIEQKIGYAQKELDQLDRILQSRQLTADERQLLSSLETKRVMPNQYLTANERAQLNKLNDIRQSSSKIISDADKVRLQSQRHDIQGEIDYMKSVLNSVNDAIAKGKPIPAEIRVKGYKLKQSLEPFTPKPTEPEISGTGRGGVGVAERTKVELQPSLLKGFELEPELGVAEKGLVEPKVKVPEIETEPIKPETEKAPETGIETKPSLETKPETKVAIGTEISPKGIPSAKGFALPETTPSEAPEVSPQIRVGLAPLPVPSTKVTPSEFAQPTPSIVTTPTPFGITAPLTLPSGAAKVSEYPAVSPMQITRGEQQPVRGTQISPTQAQLTQTRARSEALAKVEPQAKTQTELERQTQTKLQTELENKVAVERMERDYWDKTKGRFIIPLPDDNGELRLTKRQWNSIMAWKQGFEYVMKWYPYRDKKDILYTRTPIEGVKYDTGVGSANRSLVAKGIIEKVPKQDMGIMKITFETGQGRPKPVLDFQTKASISRERRIKAKRSSRRNTDVWASIGRL